MKKILSIILIIVCTLNFSACIPSKLDRVMKSHNVSSPDLDKNEESGENKEINFIDMHNSVIDELSNTYNPFFFVKENQFDIDGVDTDEVKNIKITANTIKKTTKQDVDLFLSWILVSIGQNASEQNFKYESPKKVTDNDTDGTTYVTYDDFGTVWKDFDLIVKITREDGINIYNLTVKKGNEIPFNPRYIRED